jgi:ribosomal protein S18 acetylase RimI-like enzyme
MRNSVTTRPICGADEEFLFGVFYSAQAEKFELLDLPPDQQEQLLQLQYQAQRRAYLSEFPGADFDLVLMNGVPAGNLYALRGPDRFVLIDITLLPEHRNSGVGAELIRQLIAAASAAGKALNAHVAKDNPAWHLWRRLGFEVVDDDGVYLRIHVPIS